MYTEGDMKDIDARLRKTWLALVPVWLALLGVCAWGLAARVRGAAMAAGPLLFVAVCYGLLARVWPLLRYRGFLRDMEKGLSRALRGAVLSVADEPEYRDGAWVLPVRLQLAEEAGESPARHNSIAAERLRLETAEDAGAERIVYLNASKREGFPPAGTPVALRCFGRHIREVEVVETC